DAERFATYRLHLGQGIAGWVAKTGESALVIDPMQDPRFNRQMALQIGFVPRSILCVPLILKDKAFGAIELLNKQQGEFTQDDLGLLESIAAPVAIAIQNARLDDQVQTQYNELADLFRRVERAKAEWELTIDTIDEGITLIDANCQIVRVNRTLAEWLGTTPQSLVGKHCYDVVHGTDSPPTYCPHAQLTAASRDPLEMEIDEPHLHGTFHYSAFPLRDRDGNLTGSVNVLKDVSAEKRLQAQMIQSEKLAAMGRLAASLAHEINNPLQAIQGCLDLAQTSAGNIEKQQRFLSMAQDEFNRLTNIVQHMLDFFRPSKGILSSVDLRLALNDVLSLSNKRLQHAKVNARLEWDSDIPPIAGVNNQLQQVFLNLILNAVEAMPEGGEIEIRGGRQTLEREWLTVAITDTGCGVPGDDLDKIFEPFYTTKPNGTGLGLAVCRNIIANHGGHLSVNSVVGRGSTFTVWLPLGDALSNEVATGESQSV
ncbi:MAG TPA: ATP-binding protein, partial [Anaerolineae bacterium]